MSAGFSTGENVQEETEMRSMSREEIRRVIEGKGEGLRVPILYDFWIGKEVFHGDEAGWRQWLEQYPRDIDSVFFGMPGSTEGPVEDPDYFWAAPGRKKVEGKALDAQCLIENWEEAEDFFSTFPDPESPAMLTKDVKRGEKYLLAGWWGCFFERLWALRGMENALMDFYLYPEEVHRLFDALTDFYLRAMERVKEAWDVDCFFASDDIGTQTAPFFSLEVFREFFKPYYRKLFDKAHQLGCHFWLHSCGNIELFLPEFIEIGLDVIHPIQKNTMDERRIAEQFGDKICILAGIDVQYFFAFGTPEEVRREVRYLLNTYKRPEGRFMMTMGNASTPDWKIENLEALYEETMAFNEKLYNG